MMDSNFKIMFAMVVMLSVNIRDITIIAVKNVDYHCTIHNISKSDANNLLKNSLFEDRGYIKKIIVLNVSQFFLYFFCLVYIKWLIIHLCITILILVLK